MSETLYKKVGRRYVPHVTRWDDRDLQIPVGGFVLVHAYAEGGRTYQYDVRPDTAGFRAAATIARNEMADAIREASIAKPKNGELKHYTKRQLAIIEKFREDMAAVGAMVPVWWQHKTPHDIADAAIEAVTK